jgi:uncharacterized membrane-anchored protein
MIVIIALSAAAAFLILAAFEVRPHAKKGKRKGFLLQIIKLLAMIAILFALALARTGSHDPKFSTVTNNQPSNK